MRIIIIEEGVNIINLKVDAFKLCIAFSKFLCSPVRLLLSPQIPCWYIFHEKQDNLTKYILPSNNATQSHIYLVLFLTVSQWVIMPWNLVGCSSAKSRCLQEGTPGWTQPVGSCDAGGHSLKGFRVPFLRDTWWFVWPELWMSGCLPVTCSWVAQHLCLLLTYHFSQVAGAKQVMTECYLWFWSHGRETPLTCISDAGKRQKTASFKWFFWPKTGECLPWGVFG